MSVHAFVAADQVVDTTPPSVSTMLSAYKIRVVGLLAAAMPIGTVFVEVRVDEGSCGVSWVCERCKNMARYERKK